MDDPLWNAIETDPDEHRSLAEKEQQFLLTGDSGTAPVSDMEDRIHAKAKKLPDRFQQLVDDISLLYFHGYLDNADDDLWEDLLSITNRSQVVRQSPIARTAHQHSGPELELGFEIGSLIRFIHYDPVPAEFVWGIIIGLIGESDRDWENEARNMAELFGELEDYYETRLVSAGRAAREDDGFREERSQIRELLREQGFDPAPPIVDTVLQEYTRGETATNLESPTKSSSTDPNPAEHPDPPAVSPSSEDIHRTGLESIVSRLVNQTQLRSIDRLSKDLREDVFHIQNREIWSVDLDELVCFLGKNGKTSIQDLNETKANRHSKTRALRILSYTDSTVVNRPVTQEDSNANWTLTPYGQILYKTRIEYYSTNWIYNVIAEPERLEDDIASLISRVIEDESEP
ncbi:hypothetical protein [Halorubrum vacuolatum]|uniref:Uncharacterized protein n=1 Tax=Halorubrum vacuolatum TaxID=63740 RepID=A0A238WN35_HALVU|nr:hypothetical protein [Halorubrum vacuolatum]SNR47966.1 hypothetical protein SAMN06264855_1091 [Halorubrum vacuolatum]